MIYNWAFIWCILIGFSGIWMNNTRRNSRVCLPTKYLFDQLYECLSDEFKDNRQLKKKRFLIVVKESIVEIYQTE